MPLVEGNTGRPDKGDSPAAGEGRTGSAVSETSMHGGTSDIGTWEASAAPRPHKPGLRSEGSKSSGERRMQAGEESDEQRTGLSGRLLGKRTGLALNRSPRLTAHLGDTVPSGTLGNQRPTATPRIS